MLEDIQQIAQIGSWEFDVARRMVHWSNEVCRIVEIERPAVTAHDVFLGKIHCEDRDRVAEAYNDAVRQGALQVIDYRLQFPDGRIKDVRERRAVRCGADGRIVCVSGTLQDITESKLAEAMLENEKSRLRTFLNTIPDLVWIKDQEGVYFARNPVFEQFFGAKEAEIAGVPGIVRDITERKRMEEQLHLREQAFRTIAENSPDPIARYDTECRCVYVNPALERLRGKTAAHFFGKTPLEASYGLEVLRPYEEKIREALQTGRETELELISDSFAGTGKPVCDHIRCTPEFGCDGHVVSVLVIGRDIATLKEKERRLTRSGTLLRTLVARQEKDREAERKRIAWEVHEELGQLLTVLRFDLLLMRGEPDDNDTPLQRQSQSAIHLLDRAFQIVRGLTSSLRPGVLDLGLDSALEWLAREFTRHTAIPCALHCRQAVLLNEEQVTMLFRIAQEALDNIARHAEAKSVDIVIDRRGDDYVLIVRDDGKGFDRDMPREGKFGLLLIHERARTVDGDVDIHSMPGRGTSLEVRIPASLAFGRKQHV